MAATIRKISEIAGVSRGTVDRVLNGRGRVSEEVRQRVFRIASELNYTPNAAAKALAYHKKPAYFGVVMPPASVLFFNDILEGIKAACEELKDSGVCFEVFNVSNTCPDEAAHTIHMLLKKRASGMLISAMDDISVRDAIDNVVDNGVPVITFNSDISNCKRLCFVGQDLYRSGKVAAGLMIKLLKGDSNVAVITGNMNFQAHKARVEGFVDKISAADCSIKVVDIIECYDDYSLTFTNVSKLLENNRGIDGIYMATGDVRACADAVKKFGMSDKTRIICNDTIPDVINNMKIGIIDFTLDQDPYMQGYKPIKLLYENVFLGKKPAEFNYTGIGIKIPDNI
jgi:LacI family transcriptional regulator